MARREEQTAYARGRAYFERGDIANAMSLLLEAVEEDPSNAEAHYLLGVCQFRAKRFSAAESSFRRALSLDGSSYRAHYYLGLTLERLGRTQEALIEYKLALRINPSFVKAKQKVEEFAEEEPSETSGGGHTLYDILEVSPTATAREISEAYRLHVTAWHPDKFPQGSRMWKEATERTKRINAAYDVLRDPEKRAEYDQSLGREGESRADEQHRQRESETRAETETKAHAPDVPPKVAWSWRRLGYVSAGHVIDVRELRGERGAKDELLFRVRVGAELQAVRMRKRHLLGQVRNGDQVEVVGKMKRGTLIAGSVRNLTVGVRL